MFGFGKQQEEAPRGRYVVEEVSQGPRMVKRMQAALDAGSTKGWELLELEVAQTAGGAIAGGMTAVLVWDTQPRGPS